MDCTHNRTILSTRAVTCEFLVFILVIFLNILHNSIITFFLDANKDTSDIRVISEALKVLYRDIFNETRTSPLDSKSTKKLDQIYVNLSLVTGSRIEVQRDVTYEDVFRMLANEQNIKRIAFIGEAGVGKTTLLSKIAHDWAVGKHLTDVDLLLFIPLREVQTEMRIENIIQMYVARGIDLDKQRVERYMKEKQRKVMFLCDGLDEYVGDVRNPDPNDILIGIMRGDEFKASPAIVTTRPWRAEQISSTPTLALRYELVVVNGFKKEDVVDYVKKFFYDNQQSANSLIHLITEDSLVATNMAPYPIFCCMLCNMWEQEYRRETIQALETFSQLFDEMMYSLMEHWLAKNSFRDYRKRYKKSLEEIGKVALKGLLEDKLTFTEQAFQECTESINTGCQVGVLSFEKRFTPVDTGMDGNQSQSDIQTQSDVSFSHKLFQEFLGGLYLASLYIVDQSHFWKVVKESIIPEYQKYRYLLYFTVAHGKDPGYCGKVLLEHICKEITDDEFIVDVTFECHAEEAVSPTIKYLQDTCTHLQLSARLQIIQKHTWSGYKHILGLHGRNMVRK